MKALLRKGLFSCNGYKLRICHTCKTLKHEMDFNADDYACSGGVL
jgi:hypothetical protein